MATYTVKASTLNLRSSPHLSGIIRARVARDTILTTDLTTDGDMVIVGYDDPQTPEPARQSRAWVHVVSYTPPLGQTHLIDAYAALAWLVEVHDPLPSDRLTFISPPRISRLRFTRALRQAHSPAAESAETLYAICEASHLDPAVALAFFQHESSYGTKGIAMQTRNWGNLRRGQGHQTTTYNGWAWYPTWEAGLLDWCSLMVNRYVSRGLLTVDQAIPIYAPSSDNNAPDRYIAAVYAAVRQWSTESV